MTEPRSNCEHCNKLRVCYHFDAGELGYERATSFDGGAYCEECTKLAYAEAEGTEEDPTWIISVDPDRFGVWKIVQAPDEAAAVKQLTRAYRKRVVWVKRFTPSSKAREGLGHEGPLPIPGGKRGRRKA